MTYTREYIEKMNATYQQWMDRESALRNSFFERTYKTEAGSEFMRHGLIRRLNFIRHSIDRVFEILPPEKMNANRSAILDATINLQAFLINTYGVLDNMARIWCLEADVRSVNGHSLSSSRIGLAPKYDIVRKSLSIGFQENLKKSDDWFVYLENYRHALAHRIPLYIPPKHLKNAEGDEWKRLEREILKAFQDRDYKRSEKLSNEQSALGQFKPLMMHSYGEGARPVYFHGQMICDLATVVEIGENMVAELNSLPP